MTAVIYQWQSTNQYMLHRLMPEAFLLNARPGHSLEEILSSIPSSTSIFAFHLNITNAQGFPMCRTRLVERFREEGVRLLNEQVTDIGKRKLQRVIRNIGLRTTQTEAKEGSPDDLVIVKTDRNYGGFGEAALSHDDRRILGMSTNENSDLTGTDYQIKRRNVVHDDWWTDPSLIVENFISNKDGIYYRAFICNEYCAVVTRRDHEPIKKRHNSVVLNECLTTRSELCDAICHALPSELQQALVKVQKAFKLDFGAIDVVVDDAARCFVIDLNSTSYGCALSEKAVEHLRKGLVAPDGEMREATHKPELIVVSDKTPMSKYLDAIAQSSSNLDSGNRVTTGEGAVAPRLKPAPIKYSPSYESAPDICAITCVFNCQESEQKFRNLQQMSGPFLWNEIPLYIVEACQTGHSLRLPSTSRTIQLVGGDAVWQKERLINVALERIPKHYTKIAWVDADILFENKLWLSEASALLEIHNVVQLCERIIRLPIGRHQYSGHGEVWETFGSIYQKEPNLLLQGNFGLHGHTGAGWAARRSMFDGIGLYDYCVAGGADHLMAHAFCGDWESECVSKMLSDGSQWHLHATEWAEQVYSRARARVGVVKGSALHLWHGNLATRQHVHRFTALHAHNYDPSVDVTIGADGLLYWTNGKTSLHSDLAAYIDSRRTEVV